MTSDDTAPEWLIRLLRAASLLVVGGALVAWVAPLSVPGKNLQPFGCGSPSSPMKGNLANLICNDDITGARYVAFALLVSAALLLLLSELVVPRLSGHPAIRGVAIAALISVPVAALSVGALFSPVGGEGSDGSLIRCGTALDPVTDPLAKGLCGHLPERQKSLAFGGVALSLLLLGAGAYVTSERPRVVPAGGLGDEDRDGTDPERSRDQPDPSLPEVRGPGATESDAHIDSPRHETRRSRQ